MKRRIFLQNTGLLAAGLAASKVSFAAAPDFPVVRVAASKRHFVSHVLGYKTNFVNTLKHHRVDLKRAWTNSSWHEIYLFEQLLIEVTPEKKTT